MKDRQPTKVLANGAIRYGIYREDGTLDHYEYMKREDAPTIEGTPLNKANLLSDVTENKIWNNKEKPADPTVNDALYELSKGTARMVDISMTARGDRSTSWLPCDGRAISNVEYPDLYNVLRTDVDAGDWDEIEVTGMIGTHPSISCANGHWFIAASKDAYSLKIAVSDDLETFTVASIANVGATFANIVGCSPVRYYDGKYIFAYYTSNGSSYHYIYVISASSPTGPWTVAAGRKVSAKESGSGWIPGDVLIYDGVYYVMHPIRASITQIRKYMYASSLTGSWTDMVMSDSHFNALAQDADYGPIYARRNRESIMDKFSGLINDPVALRNAIGAPMCGLAVSGDKIVVINNTDVLYSLDGGDTLTGTTSLGGITYGDNFRNPTAYDGNILAFALTKDAQHYIAIMTALDAAPMIVETEYDITGFGINGSVVAGIVDTTEDVQIKILKRDFSYSAKRIPNITPDGRSYAYIKALEE